MRVLYFHQYFATRSRATPTRSYELARRLVERGHEVTIVSGVEVAKTTSGRGSASPASVAAMVNPANDASRVGVDMNCEYGMWR